ncbi:MAG TPA: 30S ribosome-binding factor RbfA [Armatimonadetes bacterium]|nr:30S ribosome-binding factor RbfA [Armatimonadota bacterium]
MTARQNRVAAAIHREVATLIQTEMRDPRLAKVTITNATVSRDLTQARVFVSVLGERPELDAAVEALTDAAGFVRSKVGPRLRLRTVPNFTFVPDDSAARAQRLDAIFREHQAEFGTPVDQDLADSIDFDDYDEDLDL